MGRGSSGITDKMNVPFDKWGKVLEGLDAIEVIEKIDGMDTLVGYIEDEMRYITAPDEHPITRADIMREISGWKNDDGTYGDDDTTVFVAYDDGTFFSSGTNPGGLYREKLKRTGIIGASLSTPDYEMVWGGERDRAGNIMPYKTGSSFDESEGIGGKSNSYFGYKTVGQYRVRVKKTFNNKYSNGRNYTKREIIRKSTVRKVEW